MSFISLVPPIYTNVKSFGAVGDGVTDDTTAIKAALASIPTATGGVLYTPPNMICLVSSTIDTSAFSGNLFILGGGTSSIWKLANNANCYLLSNTSGSMTSTRVSNMKFDCNSVNQTSASGGIYGYKWRRCLLDFVWIHNPWQAGIYLIGDPGDFGYQNRIANCWIEGGSNVTSGTNAYGNAIRFENTDENTVYGTHFENNGNFSDTTFGFHIYDKNGLSSYHGNSFVNGAGVFKLDGLQNRIYGNAFDGNGGNLVQINGSAADTIITNNTAINVGYRALGGSPNSVNGIYVNATGCIIKNNYFDSDASATPKTNSFVKIDVGATYGQVENNVFNIRAGSGTLTGPIIFVSGQPTGTRVGNNNGYDFVNNRPSFLTENHGLATVLAGTTSIVVPHGLAVTPLLEQISITPQGTLSAASSYWVSNPTSTSFTINVNVNPTVNVTFGWRVGVGF